MEFDCVFKHGLIFFMKTFHKSDSPLFRCTSLKGNVFVKVADGFRTVIVLYVRRLLNTGARQYAGVNVDWCSRLTLHHTDHINNCSKRIVG